MCRAGIESQLPCRALLYDLSSEGALAIALQMALHLVARVSHSKCRVLEVKSVEVGLICQVDRPPNEGSSLSAQGTDVSAKGGAVAVHVISVRSDLSCSLNRME